MAINKKDFISTIKAGVGKVAKPAVAALMWTPSQNNPIDRAKNRFVGKAQVKVGSALQGAGETIGNYGKARIAKMATEEMKNRLNSKKGIKR